MTASKLFNKLNNDFINDKIQDINWANRMPDLHKYLYHEFKQNGGMGLMCDFTDEIEKVYTTVFLSENIFSKMLESGVKNALIFSHHPTSWDLESHTGCYAINKKYIKALKERNISVYILHHPLDNFGIYSTGKTLADKLGIIIKKPAFLYFGAKSGIIGTIKCKTIKELHEHFSQILGHKTSLYQYGDENIAGELIALCPGGGNSRFVIDEMIEENIKVLITGVTIVNDYSREIHELEKDNRINVLGGTHYSTEKYALIEMCKYFSKIGLPSEFIEDKPKLFDL